MSEEKNTVISILLPTRGRTDVLLNSLKTLIEKASKPQRLEILLGIDEDDTEIQPFLKDVVAPWLKEYSLECRANIFKPLGYENLHIYVNTLAANATGEWIFFWNDDALMVTEGWDDVIESYNGQFKLLAPKDNHNGHPYAILPIIPTDCFFSDLTFMGLTHLFSHAFSVIYFSIDPIVTVPCPDCSITQLPSQSRSCGHILPQTSGILFVL